MRLLRSLMLVWVWLLHVGCGTIWSDEDQAIQDWLDDGRYEAAMDRLLPVDCDGVVSCRVTRDFWVEEHEFAISVLVGPGESSTAVLRRPVGSSLWEQLWRLHKRTPSAALEDLLNRVVVESYDVTVEECARLSELLGDGGERVPFDASPPGSITIHPWVRTCCGRGQPVVTVTEGTHPLATWVEDAVQALQSCWAETNRGDGAGRGPTNPT